MPNLLVQNPHFNGTQAMAEGNTTHIVRRDSSETLNQIAKQFSAPAYRQTSDGLSEVKLITHSPFSSLSVVLFRKEELTNQV